MSIGDDLRQISLERFGPLATDRFVVLDELARGGLGRVLRARDPRSGRIVALKEVLRPSPEIIRRFAREALVTANLQHPSIIPVYEVGRWRDGEPFYAMKLVRGRALDALIAEARTTAERIALVPHVINVADALAYAHSERVIHRDLKPGNILIGPYGETEVIDWGLARILTGEDDEARRSPLAPATADAGDTVVGAVVGTPTYMPPEQANGDIVDERADVYAIGAILYHVLAGQRPHADARSIDEILTRVVSGPPRPLAELAPDVPPELIAIVAKAMAHHPAYRYPTAEGLADDLRRFQAGQMVGAHRYSPWTLIRRWISRHRAAVATALVAAVALVAFGAISVRRIAEERDQANRQHLIAQQQRSEAQASRTLAEQRFAASLEELGRQALPVSPDRGLAFLTGAAGLQPEIGPTLALLLGQARAAFAGLHAVAPSHPTGTVSADVVPGRALLLTTTTDQLRAWDLERRRTAWSAAGVHHALASPDGRWVLATSLDGAVVAFRAADGGIERRWLPPPGNPEEHLTLLAWSKTGSHFAVGGNRGRVLVGSVDRGFLTTAEPHGGEIYGLEFSPDGSRLASCSVQGTTTVHDPLTGATQTQLPRTSEEVVGCTWRGDDRVVVANGNGAIDEWRIADRQRVRHLDHGPDLYGIAIASDRSWLLSYGHGETAKLWDLSTGQVRALLPGHRLAVNFAVTVSSWLVTSDETGGLFVWDPDTGDRVQALPPEGPAALATRDGSLITYGEGRARIWRLAPETTLRRWFGHTARVRDLAFDRRGILWSASNDGSARGIDVATGTARTLGRADFREPAILDPDHQPPGTGTNPHGLRSLTIDPSGERVITAGEDGLIGVWDMATGALRTTWRGHTGRVRKVVFDRHARTAYSVGDTTIRRWDVATGRELARADLGDVGWDIALVNDDIVVTLTDKDRRLALWHATDLSPGPPLEFNSDRLREIVIANGRMIVASAEQLMAIDASGKIQARVAHALAFAVSVAPDGSALVAGNPRGEVVLHDARTLQPLRSWGSGDVMITAVRYRPDGAIVATAVGRRIRIWDPATGQLLATSPELPAMLTQLVWSADGHKLAFAGASGTVWIWNLGPGSRADLDPFTRCVTPWTLVGSSLLATPFDPTACAVLQLCGPRRPAHARAHVCARAEPAKRPMGRGARKREFLG